MLNDLGQEIVAINQANGWDVLQPSDWPEQAATDPEATNALAKTRKIGTVLALIHSEVSEALEGLRHHDRANFEEELADILIRVLDASAGLGVDMDAVVQAKMEKNRARGIRHGGKAV